MQRQSQQKTQETIEAYQRINQGNMRHAALMHERGDLGDLTDGTQCLSQLQPSESAVRSVSGEDSVIKSAFDARPAPHSTEWPWRAIRGSQHAGGPGWPFPIHIEVSDRAKTERLHKEGVVRQQLGAVFTQTNGYGVNSVSSQSAEATQAWQQLEDAGRTLQTLGMALVVLAQGLSPKRRCSVCQRHLGPKSDRIGLGLEALSTCSSKLLAVD